MHFEGTIESFPAGFIGDWRIGGRTVHVTSSTRIETNDGAVAVGAFAEVEGTMRADSSMDATKVEVKSNPAGGDGRDELKGAIESLPNTQGFIGDWRVAGRSINASRIEVSPNNNGGINNDEGQPTNVKGTIQSLPNTADLTGDWVVSGRTVHVTSSTRLDREHGSFATGVRVKVKGLQMSDGSVVATKIQVRDSQ